MAYRVLTKEDVKSLLEMYGCSEVVIVNATRQLEMVNMFLKLQPFTRVAAAYQSECQFFEEHVLQDEVSFVDFYNGLLDRLEIKGGFMGPTMEAVAEELDGLKIDEIKEDTEDDVEPEKSAVNSD